MLGTMALVVLGASGAWGEIGVGGTGSLTSFPTSRAGSGSAGLAAYLHHRLIEDGAPYSLQPYLQRTGSIGGNFSVSGFSTDGSPDPYTGNAFGGSLSLDAYSSGAFTLWVYGAFARSETHGGFPGGETTYLLPRAELAPGVRFGDTRVSLGYRYAPTIADGVYDGRGFGEPFLRVDHVVARKVWISGIVQLILSGARASLDLAAHPLRELGIGVSLEYAEGAIYYDSRTVYRRLQAGPEITWWIGERGRIGLSYEFSHTLSVHDPLDTRDTHRLTLGFGLRLG